MLCAAHNKLLINAALGFDTYLVMRHGQQQKQQRQSGGKREREGEGEHDGGADSAQQQQREQQQLGCYFCNDVVAATNSQRDRTLDQQCTVTRPGLAFIAAALCVELMVALLQKQQKQDGAGDNEDENEDSEGEDSSTATRAQEVPHQIRGSVAGFTQFTPKGRFTTM